MGTQLDSIDEKHMKDRLKTQGTMCDRLKQTISNSKNPGKLIMQNPRLFSDLKHKSSYQKHLNNTLYLPSRNAKVTFDSIILGSEPDAHKPNTSTTRKRNIDFSESKIFATDGLDQLTNFDVAIQESIPPGAESRQDFSRQATVVSRQSSSRRQSYLDRIRKASVEKNMLGLVQSLTPDADAGRNFWGSLMISNDKPTPTQPAENFSAKGEARPVSFRRMRPSQLIIGQPNLAGGVGQK